MNKIAITVATTTVVILLLFIGCYKIIINKYEGTWNFVTIRSCSQASTPDTLYYTGPVRGGMYKDEVEIGYTEYNYPFLKVNASGELFADRGAYKVGQFEGKDKVHIEMGCDVVYGVRISKN